MEDQDELQQEQTRNHNRQDTTTSGSLSLADSPDVRVKIEEDDEAYPPLSSLPYFQPRLQPERHLVQDIRDETPPDRQRAGDGTLDGLGSCFYRAERA